MSPTVQGLSERSGFGIEAFDGLKAHAQLFDGGLNESRCGEERLQAIKTAIPLTEDIAVITLGVSWLTSPVLE